MADIVFPDLDPQDTDTEAILDQKLLAAMRELQAALEAA